MLLRLTHDLRVRSGMVAQLVAIAVDDQCCDLVRTILNVPDIEVEHCDQLLTLLAEHEANAIDAFVEGNRAEYIHCRQAIHDLQHRTGTFDPKFMRDELGMEGWSVYLDLDGNGLYDSGEPETTTDATGKYSFIELPAWQDDFTPPAQYTVRAIGQEGWLQTLPSSVSAGEWTIQLDPGEIQAERNFGYFYHGPGGQDLDVIAGRLFLDLNGNGIQDDEAVR